MEYALGALFDWKPSFAPSSAPSLRFDEEPTLPPLHNPSERTEEPHASFRTGRARWRLNGTHLRSYKSLSVC
jgi:hypothetical protein